MLHPVCDHPDCIGHFSDRETRWEESIAALLHAAQPKYRPLLDRTGPTVRRDSSFISEGSSRQETLDTGLL